MDRNMGLTNKKTTANIGLAIVGQTVVNSTLAILLGFCAKVGQTFFKCPPSPSRKPLAVIIYDDTTDT
jgi:hypothetical protein